MSSRNVSLLSLGLCLPLLSPYPSPPPPNPFPKPQLYALDWSQVRASPSACAPWPCSYHRGHQCLEQEDWEVAVLFFSRGLHLDSQLVRGMAWVGTGSCWPRAHPSLSHLPGPFSQGHQVPVVAECQASRRIVRRGTAAWVPSPTGRILCLESRGLHPALRLFLGRPEPSKGLLLPAGEHGLPGAAHLGALPEGAWGCPRPTQGPTSHPGLLTLPPATWAVLVPETSPDSLGTFVSLCLCPHLLPR